MPKVSDEIRGRIDPKWPENIRNTSEVALQLLDRFDAARDQLNRHAADYVPVLRQRFATEFAGEAGKLSAAVSAHRDAVLVKRQALSEKAFKSPASPALAAEIRQYLRSLPHDERLALMTGEKADQRTISAALEGPAYLSGSTPEFLQQVRDDYLSRVHGSELAEISTAAGAVEFAEAAAGTFKALASDDLGFRRVEEFDGWMASVTPKAEPATRDKDEAERLAAIDARLAQFM